jgi:membrane protein DedA with SNARE-associated domain
MQYSLGKFLAAMTVGRFVRYSILAYLGATYGRHILSLFSRHAYTTLLVAVGLGVAALIIVLLVRKRSP